MLEITPKNGKGGEVGAKKGPSVDDLTGAEALAVLGRLWAEGGAIRDAIRTEIENQLAGVVPDHVADAVLADLDGISVEELWDRSGPSRFGYTDPAEATWEIVEEALKPYVDELERYLRFERTDESLLYCVGLLEGIYAFGTESDSEFRTWAPDDPHEAFHWVLDKWSKAVSDQAARDRLEHELSVRCPEWHLEGGSP
jgi:hypothetical protein